MAVSCEAKCGKSILLSFTLIHWLAGVALIVLGTSILVNPHKLHIFQFVTFDTVHRDYGIYLAYFLLTLGGSIFVVSWAGCCGAIKEIRLLLVLYFVFLLLLSLFEIAMSVVVYNYREEWLDGLEGRLQKQLVDNYGNHSSREKYLTFSDAMDLTQHKFGCCGIHNDSDYRDSKWVQKSPGFPTLEDKLEDREKYRNLVPLTCCVLKSPEEPYVTNSGSPISTLQRDTPHGTVEEHWQTPNVANMTRCQMPKFDMDFALRNRKGCFPVIVDWFRQETTILVTVGFSTAILQALGMILTICLCQNLTEDI